MPTLNRLSQEYSHLSWALVYTLEAHATDEWPISSARYEPSGKPVSIRQHQTDEERLRALRNFQATFKIPFQVVADKIEGTFEAHFSTWPFRFYIIKNQRVFWRAQPKECTYSVQELCQAMDRA